MVIRVSRFKNAIEVEQELPYYFVSPSCAVWLLMNNQERKNRKKKRKTKNIEENDKKRLDHIVCKPPFSVIHNFI